jgi:hypothetical protein
MFNKKCSKCDKKIDKEFEFCPYCGHNIHKEKYGILGKSDDLNQLDNLFKKSFANSQGNSILDKMMSSAIGMIQKEMQKSAIESQKNAKPTQNPAGNPNFELFINGKKLNLPGNIAGVQIERMNGNKDNPENSPKKQKIVMQEISEEILKNSVKLPRKEAKTKLIRTDNKVIYELETPGIASINEVLINKMESSFEIKAYTPNAVYFKNLPVKLTLVKYSIKPDENKLILEFNAQ